MTQYEVEIITVEEPKKLEDEWKIYYNMERKTNILCFLCYLTYSKYEEEPTI